MKYSKTNRDLGTRPFQARDWQEHTNGKTSINHVKNRLFRLVDDNALREVLAYLRARQQKILGIGNAMAHAIHCWVLHIHRIQSLSGRAVRCHPMGL